MLMPEIERNDYYSGKLIDNTIETKDINKRRGKA